MPDRKITERREILRSIGSAGLVSLSGVQATGVASATSGSDLQVKAVSGEMATNAVDAVIESDTFKNLRRSVQSHHRVRITAADPHVLYRNRNGNEKFIVRYSIDRPFYVFSDEQRTDDELAVLVNSNYEVLSGKATLRHDDSITTFSAEDGTVKIDTVDYESGSRNNETGTVRTFDSSQCDLCKDVYDVLCDFGCNIGAASACYIATGGSGYVSGVCGAMVGDLCEFIENNSCDAGLPEAVCQLVGFCPTNGEDPCERFDEGEASQYCDA